METPANTLEVEAVRQNSFLSDQFLNSGSGFAGRREAPGERGMVRGQPERGGGRAGGPPAGGAVLHTAAALAGGPAIPRACARPPGARCSSAWHPKLCACFGCPPHPPMPNEPTRVVPALTHL